MFRTAAKGVRNLAQITQPHTTDRQLTPRTRFEEKLKEVKANGNAIKQLIKIYHEEGHAADQHAREQAAKARQYEPSIHNPYAREAAHTFRIIRTLSDFLDAHNFYDFRGGNVSLLDCIKPEHLGFLIDSFKVRFSDMILSEKISLASSFEPGILERIGINLDTDIKARISAKQETRNPKDLLDFSETISLVEYTNSDTNVFNIVNNAARMKAYYGEGIFQELVEPLSNEISSGRRKIEKSPELGAHNIYVVKGIRTSGPYSPLECAYLEDCLAQGTPLFFPNMISTTSNVDMSYARTKCDLGYTIELHILLESAARVGLFHSIKTKFEEEVLAGEGLKFMVIGKEINEFIQDGKAYMITRYKLIPVKVPA